MPLLIEKFVLCFCSRSDRTFQQIPFSQNGLSPPMTVPHSNAFVDLDGDSTAGWDFVFIWICIT